MAPSGLDTAVTVTAHAVCWEERGSTLWLARGAFGSLCRGKGKSSKVFIFFEHFSSIVLRVSLKYPRTRHDIFQLFEKLFSTQL